MQAIIVLAILMVAPIVAASTPISADFTVRGAVHLPSASELAVTPTAALIEDTSNLKFVLSTPSLQVCEHETDAPELSAVDLVFTSQPIRRDARCYTQTEVRIELAPDGDHVGWLGFYPAPGVRLHLTSAFFDARRISTIASSDANVGSARDDIPERPIYYQRTSGEHLFITATGEARYEGPGALKVKGLDLVVVAAENTTRHETYSRLSDEGPVRERQERWLYLEFEEAVIEMRGSVPMTLASREAQGAWDGRLSLQSVKGAAIATGGEYHATGRDGWIEGSFTGTFLPLGDERVRLIFEGDMRTTSIPFEPGPVVPSVAGISLLGLVAVVLAGSAAVGGVFIYQTARKNAKDAPQEPNVENERAYYIYHAELADDLGFPDLALEWLEAGAPYGTLQDAALIAWQALLYRGLDRHTEAIRSFERAVAVPSPMRGLFEYYLAACHMDHDDAISREQALIHLERALACQPDLVGTIERDPAFTQIRGADFDAMLSEAEARLMNDLKN